jgi:dUTP pyrophosphatase
MSIRIALENENCEPYKGNRWDGGWDLRSNNPDITIEPGQKVKMYTGVKMEIPVRHIGMVVPRSGLGSKYRVGLANTVGIIDSDYRGEIIVNLVNNGEEPLTIKQFDRFCQIVVMPVRIDTFRIVEQLQGTERGEDGFGSSGVE